MRWSDFVAAVLTELPVDKERIAIATGSPNFLNQQIVHCVTQLQKLVPFYQGGHETVYGPNDLVLEGFASRGSLPQGSQARPLDVFYKRMGQHCVSQPLADYDWGNRMDLVCGACQRFGSDFLITFDPWGKEFLVYPSVYEDHQITLAWSGVKTVFADNDETPFEMDVVELAGLFCKAKIARHVDHDLAEYGSYMTEHSAQRRLIYADVRERTRLGLTRTSAAIGTNCGTSASTCTPCDGTTVTGESITEYCAFGDSGEMSTIANTAAVANLVKSLEPDFIMHMGDSVYPHGEPYLIQDSLVKYYGAYIPRDFYMAFGNHDIETDGGEALKAILTKQVALNAGKNYYDFLSAEGTVHIFVLDTNGDPVEQAAWLQPRLEASTAWNVVHMHKAPYTSDDEHGPGDVVWRLPFKDWGAHVVIAAHGHDYERLLIEQMLYIVAGLGGATKRGFNNPPMVGSQFRYNSFYGTLWITATCTRLQISFYDTRGEMVDSVALEIPPTFLPQTPPVIVPVPDNGSWCQLRGTLPPEGLVIANQDCWYRRDDGINFEFWFHATGGGTAFGWMLVEKLA